MASVNDSANGANPQVYSNTTQGQINAELAVWVYHYADDDQALGLGEIEANASIFKFTNTAAVLSAGFEIAPDGFIYNATTGFLTRRCDIASTQVLVAGRLRSYIA